MRAFLAPWDIFEREAGTYDDWYATPRGRRAHMAECALLEWLLGHFPGAGSVVEVGCGTGHFTGWLGQRGLTVVGLDRAPQMLRQMRRRAPGIPCVLGEARRLPFRDGAIDLVALITTLEFLDERDVSLREAVRVAYRGLMLVVLNRWSVGALCRRCRLRAGRGALLGRARDYSLSSLREGIAGAAGARLREVRWTSALFLGLPPRTRARVPLGDVVGVAVLLKAPRHHRRSHRAAPAGGGFSARAVTPSLTQSWKGERA